MRGTSVDLTAAPVSDADHVALSRLVIEHAWRLDSGRADTLHELYVEEGELYVLPSPLLGRSAIQEWGRELDHDRFVRTDLGWRFAERHWRELFSVADA